MPVGIGEPFFDSIESKLAHIIFSIPGVRGIEFGDGFAAAKMMGSQHNDPFVSSGGKTIKNGSGGINGGISNGNELVFRIAVKPTSSISLPQNTYNFSSGKVEELKVEGRHDTCFALRVPVIVEAATAIVLADMLI
jgi:chorismate synthase